MLAPLSLGCSGTYEPGEALLPGGMAQAVVPDVSAASYLYVSPDGPMMLPLDSFGPTGTEFNPGARPGSMLRTSGVTLFVGKSPNGFGGIFDFDNSTGAANALITFRLGVNPERSWSHSDGGRLRVAVGDPGWVQRVEDASGLTSFVSLERHPSLPWDLVTNLPAEPPSRPVAAGIANVDEGLAGALYDSLDLDLTDIDTAFALLRVDLVGFAIYTDDEPLVLPERLDRRALEENAYGVLMVSRSDFSGVMVAFMLGVVSDRGELETIQIANTNARYGTVDGLHLLLKNRGNLVFAALSANRQNAIDLILSAIDE